MRPLPRLGQFVGPGIPVTELEQSEGRAEQLIARVLARSVLVCAGRGMRACVVGCESTLILAMVTPDP